MSDFKPFKVVNSLPSTLEPDSVYYVKKGEGFDQYVTNGSGIIRAYPMNMSTGQIKFPVPVQEVLFTPGDGVWTKPSNFVEGSLRVTMIGAGPAVAVQSTPMYSGPLYSAFMSGEYLVDYLYDTRGIDSISYYVTAGIYERYSSNGLTSVAGQAVFNLSLGMPDTVFGDLRCISGIGGSYAVERNTRRRIPYIMRGDTLIYRNALASHPYPHLRVSYRDDAFGYVSPTNASAEHLGATEGFGFGQVQFVRQGSDVNVKVNGFGCCGLMTNAGTSRFFESGSGAICLDYMVYSEEV